MNSTSSTELQQRVDERIAAWRIISERIVEAHSSILVFGRRVSVIILTR